MRDEPSPPPGWTTLAASIAALAVAWVAGLSVAAAEPVPEEIRVEDETIERVDPETGERRWRVVHPSLHETKGGQGDLEMAGPVALDGRLFYGVRGWLIELDPETGVIRERRLFPSQIVAVRAKDAHLAVTVEWVDEYEEGDARTEFSYEPGDETPPEIWDPAEVFGVWTDVTGLDDRLLNDAADIPEKQRSRALERVERRRRQEPDNPWYDYVLGWLHELGDEDDRAEAAYRRAAEAEGIHWTSQLMLAAHFDSRDRHDLADRVFERAKERISSDEHVRVRQWYSAFHQQALLSGWFKDAVERAVRERDFDRVDRMLSRVAWTFPSSEHTETAWRILADWYAENGQSGLAEQWRGHAADAAETPWRSVDHAYRTIDRTFVVIVGCLPAFLLGAFLIGARRARPDEQRGWVPELTLPEFAALLATILIPVGALWFHQHAYNTVEHAYGEVPVEVLADGWSSPNATEWLEGLDSGPARDQLLEEAKRAAEATRTGDLENRRVPDTELVVDVIEARARRDTWRAFAGDGSFSFPSPFDERHQIFGAWFACLLLGFGTGLLGGVLGSVAPGVVRYLRWFLPGGARSAHFATPLILALVCTAVASLGFGLDQLLQRATLSEIGQGLGLSQLYTEERLTPSRLWAWLALGAALAVHAGTLWWDATSDFDERDPA